MASMKALRFHGQKDLRIDSVPVPELKAGQVKVKPEWCGICGTDLHEYIAGPILIPTDEKPHKLTGESLPVILGHEFAGEIVEVAPDVEEAGKLKVGMKVCCEPNLFDGTCVPCLDGRRNCCYKAGAFGLVGYGGGFSEYACLNAQVVYPLPENIPTHIGALVEPLSVAWHAITTAGHQPTHSSLIIGAGPIGLSILLALLAQGARQILISEVSAQRIQHALDIASDHPEVDIRVLDPTKADVAEKAKELDERREGPDVVYDCAGVQKSIDTAIKAVRRGGVVCNVAVWETKPTIDINELVFGEKKIIAVVTFMEGDFEAVIEAISSGKIRKPEKLITAKIALDDAITDGFEALLKSRDHVKILVHP